LLTVAVTYGVLLRIAALGSFFGSWLALVVALSLWRYSYELLREVARGTRYHPAPGIETMNPISEVSLVLHFVFWFLLSYLIVTTPFLGQDPYSLLRWTVLAIALAPFPASAAVMGLTRNLGAAMNPVSVAVVMRVLGRDYLKLLGSIVCVAAIVVLASRELGGLSRLVADIVAVWGVLAFFALSGAAIAGRRDDFDFPGEIETRRERDERWRQDGWQKTLDRAYGSIRSGLVPQGYRTIKGLLESENESLEIYQWTFNKMILWEEKSHALELGDKFIARLLSAGRSHDALELANQCRRFGAKLAVPAAVLEELVSYARTVGRHRLADELEAIAPAKATPAP
jgi:hypothetical protein